MKSSIASKVFHFLILLNVAVNGYSDDSVGRIGSPAIPMVVQGSPIPIGPPGPGDAGRIVRVQRMQAVTEFKGNSHIIESMVESGVRGLVAGTEALSPWSSVVSSRDRIGIFIAPQGWSDTSTLAPVVSAVVGGLQKSGVSPYNIFIWSRQSQDIRKLQKDLTGILPATQFTSSVERGYDESVTYDSPIPGKLIWSDHKFGRVPEDSDRVSHVSRLLTHHLDRIIAIGSMTSDASAGVRGHLFSLCYGSVDNFNRFLNHPEILSETVPEVFALPPLADKTCLFITDALIGSVAGNKPGKFHLHPPVCEIWMSRDPVALDAYTLERVNQLRSKIGFGDLPDSSRDLLFNSELMELGKASAEHRSVISVP